MEKKMPELNPATDLNLIHTSHYKDEGKFVIGFKNLQERTLFKTAAEEVLKVELKTSTNPNKNSLKRFLVEVSDSQIKAISSHIDANNIQPNLGIFLKSSFKVANVVDNDNVHIVRISGGSRNTLENLVEQLKENGITILNENKGGKRTLADDGGVGNQKAADFYDTGHGMFELRFTDSAFKHLDSILKFSGKEKQ